MKWTTELPSEPGWYWVRHRKGYRTVAEIVCLTTTGRIIGIGVNCGLQYLAKHYDLFSGPISEPQGIIDA